jgi:hypothetical protein
VRTRAIIVTAMMLLSVAVCAAQEQSLGDVARENRTGAQDAKPSKVLTEDDADRPAITANDNPVAVINKAVAAMVHDTSHRCIKLNTGSAQGLPLSRTIEIAAPDRVHVSVDQESRRLADAIEIGNDVYEKLGEGPWKKATDNGRAGYLLDLLNLVPEEVKFGGGWKLVSQMVINGAATFQYQMPLRTSDVDETVNLWIGAGDYLPRRTQIQSRYLKENLTRDETTNCTYGLNIKIEPPL